MVAAELSPYVRETPAADSVAALCKALRQFGHDVTVALPRHPGFEAGGLLVARRLTPLTLAGGAEVTVFDGQLASGTKLALFDAPALFERPGVYGEAGQDYADNPKRFGVLAQAAAALAQSRAEHGDAFDVLHGHDWPGALVPLVMRPAPEQRLPAVLTVHDARRAGRFAPDQLPELGISEEGLTGELRDDGWVSVLKGGLALANAVTTVSPSYARELEDPKRFGSLAEAIRGLGRPVIGITNGIEYATFNPATDPVLASRYDAEDASNKGRCKTAFLRELGLELELERPLVVAYGPIAKERGFDVILGALPAVLKDDLYLVIVAGDDADAELLAAFEREAAQAADRLVVLTHRDPGRVRKAAGAADFVLSSARYEPCGDAQLIAQRYGALPVALATGGILDTVVDCDEQLETGSGFLFDDATPKSLLGALQRALAARQLPAWPRLVRRVMRQDLAWDRPARRYLQVYRQALAAG